MSDDSEKFADKTTEDKFIFLAKLIGIPILIALLGLLIFRWGWVTFIDNYEFGFSYNLRTGQIEKLDRTGYIIRTPFIYSVHGIDTRPYQVSISANERILNAKLVRFDPKGLELFLEWHGRSAGDDSKKLQEILKCYAFDRDEGADCPFLEVVSVLAPNQGQAAPKKAAIPQVK